MSERGRLEVTVDGNASGFNQVLNAAKQNVRQFAGEVKTGISSSVLSFGKGLVGGFIGAFSIDGIKGFIESIFNQAAGLKDLAERFDVSTDEIGKWEKALEKANVPATKFYRALETLRAKRQELRENPGKESPFDSLGLRTEASGYHLSDTELVRRILGSKASRPDINAALGPGGAQLKAAMEFYSGATPTLSGNDIETLDTAQKKLEGLGGIFKKIAAWTFLETMDAAVPQIKEKTQSAWQNIWNLITLAAPTAGAGIGIGRRMLGIETDEEKAGREKREAAQKAQREEEAKASDELARRKREVAEAKRDTEAAGQNIEMEERLKEAQRKNMNAGQRRSSLQKDLKEANDWIKHIEGLGPTEDPTTKLWLNEWKLKAEKLKTELKEAPVSLSADSLAKSGLFAGSALNFSTDQSTQKQQVALLKEISTNTKNTCFNWGR